MFVSTVVVGSVAYFVPFTVTRRPFLRDVVTYLISAIWVRLLPLLACCLAALMPCCLAALLPCCPAALLPCCLAFLTCGRQIFVILLQEHITTAEAVGKAVRGLAPPERVSTSLLGFIILYVGYVLVVILGRQIYQSRKTSRTSLAPGACLLIA